ncbi:unnamed protein product [Rotaria sordida]|uniref:TIR domain-containing protein n=1 Tax=Rotaria sordida TaxID=392033 RepID=A0A815UDX0_9BILA|nr:unnamed protein product [Rotaria sordida]CAF1514899.1 unnamed protein product [Rotaria sordida]
MMEVSTIIEQQCALIKDQGTSVTNDQLKTCLDNIVIELNQDKMKTNVATIQQIVSSISFRLKNDQAFYEAKLVDHQLFLIIRDYYLDILRRWRTGQVLDPMLGQVFTQIAILFAELCFHATDADVDLLKQLLIHESLINEICACLKDIATSGKHLQDQHVKAIDYTVRAIHYLGKGRIDIQSMAMFCELHDSIVNCVCSNYFASMFKQIAELEKLNEAQTFLLDTCTDYICWHDAGHYNDTCIAIRTALLNIFTCWFQDQLLSFHKLSRVAIQVIGQLCITLIGGNASDEELFPQPIREDYCKMIDQISSILNTIMESETVDEITKALIRVLAQNLYSLTMTNDLRTYIKSKNMIPLLLKLTNIEDETIQFHVYRILASIMTEEDMKTLTNSTKIANVFLGFLINLIDDSSMIPRFHNLLRSLKILVQHDQIKEELTKQGVLPLLLRCVTESKFDLIKVRLSALEILLALTFNDDAARQLKNNSEFISNLKTLVTSSTNRHLQRVAENLLWKLEIEETAITKSHGISTISHVASKKYDIMLSYSHSDKELCYRIHDCLVKDNFRVWIDRDQMHGQTMVAMATAIENSYFVFLCMSEAYKQSAYCQSEAHYAFERQCCLIPLVMKSGYRPDGWLGIIASGKIYIDFSKLGFDVAYEKLKNEIIRYRTNQVQSTSTKKSFRHDLDVKTINPPVKSDEQYPLIEDYPHCINQWTTDHVRSFLINEKLDCLLPVLGNMNGRLLHETHKRCKAHWDLMFQTFKAEVTADNQQKLLTIDTYIRFLDVIEKYIPIVPNDKSKPSTSSSTFCTLI